MESDENKTNINEITSEIEFLKKLKALVEAFPQFVTAISTISAALSSHKAGLDRIAENQQILHDQMKEMVSVLNQHHELLIGKHPELTKPPVIN